MHYDLTITLPGRLEDAHRMISAMVERQLVPPDRATYSENAGRVRIRWERVHVDEENGDGARPILTAALAELAAVAGDGATRSDVPHIYLDLDESRRLSQADFDPSEDL